MLKLIWNLFSNNFLAPEAINQFNKIKEIKQKINRDDLIYKTRDKKKNKTWKNSKTQKFKTIRIFGT